VSECYQVCTVINLPNGSSFRAPMQAFDSQPEAEKAYSELSATIGGLLKDAVVTVKTTEGKAISPMTLAQFLATLGISGIGHSIVPVPIHGAVVLASRPNIILPS